MKSKTKKNIVVLDHPLILDKISRLRDRKTAVKDFRNTMNEISMLMVYEALKDIRLKTALVRTPLGYCRGKIVAQDVIFVTILRAGLGMLDGALEVYPDAKISHVGIYRNEETLSPVKYYFKMPRGAGNSLVLLIDPMLATGGSAVEAVNLIKRKGAGKIVFLTLIAARKGIDYFSSRHPDVKIVVGAVDEKLNGRGYIVPGLGDAGDRMFGT